jgi:hypothetical protein
MKEDCSEMTTCGEKEEGGLGEGGRTDWRFEEDMNGSRTVSNHERPF